VSRRNTIVGLGIAAWLVAGLVVLHTGARGERLCNENGFSGDGSLSWWPPGVSCFGGEPAFEKVYLSPLMFIVVALAFVALPALRLPSRGDLSDRPRGETGERRAGEGGG
jgi:hypothetical protein